MKYIKNYPLIEAKKRLDPEIRAAKIEDPEKEDFDKTAWAKVQVGIIYIGTKYGFFASILSRLNIKQAPKRLFKRIKTMATDGVSIFYNPEFVKGLTANQVVFVLAHEVMHCAFRHMFREKGLNAVDHRRWNEAGDYAINTILFDPEQSDKATMCIGEPIPCMLWDKKFQGMSAENIYKLLEKGEKGGYWTDGKEQCGGDGGGGGGGGGGDGDDDEVEYEDEDEGDEDDKKKGKKGKGGKGKGAGGPGKGKGEQSQTGTLDETFAPGELQGGVGGRDAEKPMGDKDTEKREMEKEWKKVVNTAKSRGAGKGPGVFARALEKLGKPQLNWRTILKRYLKEILDKTVDKPWTRRFISGKGPGREMYIPGEQEEYGKIKRLVIGVDTSGSISDEDLEVFGSEMAGILVEYRVESIDILPCDDVVHNVEHYKDPKKTIIRKTRYGGGGGTSFDPVFEWIDKNMIAKNKKPDVVLYFTDGYPFHGTGDHGWPSVNKWKIKSYKNDIIWVIVNDRTNNIKVPFGRRLDVDTEFMHDY